MSHYFIDDKNLKHNIQKRRFIIANQPIYLYTDNGVFSKDKIDFGTQLLIKCVDVNEHVKKIIDMGCGYGPIGIYFAKNYKHLHTYMYDCNLRAVELSQKNIELNRLDNSSVQESYLFENVDQMADLIITNPPIRAGKAVVFKLYEQAYNHLNPGGALYVVIQKKQGAPSSVKKIEEIFASCSIICKNKGYWILLAKKSL